MSLTTFRMPAGWSFSIDSNPTETAIEWRLRYKPGELTISERLEAASIMGQFAHLLEPTVDTASALALLTAMRQTTHEYLTHQGDKP